MSVDNVDDDYPSEETLNALRTWPWQDCAEALDRLKAEWHWPDCASHALRPEEALLVHADESDRFLRLATGGWSGNESLVSAYEANGLCTAFTWRLHAIGGLHIYRYTSYPSTAQSVQPSVVDNQPTQSEGE